MYKLIEKLGNNIELIHYWKIGYYILLYFLLQNFNWISKSQFVMPFWEAPILAVLIHW